MHFGYVRVFPQVIFQLWQEEQVFPHGMWLLILNYFKETADEESKHNIVKFNEIFQSTKLKIMFLNLAREKKLTTYRDVVMCFRYLKYHFLSIILIVITLSFGNISGQNLYVGWAYCYYKIDVNLYFKKIILVISIFFLTVLLYPFLISSSFLLGKEEILGGRGTLLLCI